MVNVETQRIIEREFVPEGNSVYEEVSKLAEQKGVEPEDFVRIFERFVEWRKKFSLDDSDFAVLRPKYVAIRDLLLSVAKKFAV